MKAGNVPGMREVTESMEGSNYMTAKKNLSLRSSSLKNLPRYVTKKQLEEQDKINLENKLQRINSSN